MRSVAAKAERTTPKHSCMPESPDACLWARWTCICCGSWHQRPLSFDQLFSALIVQDGVRILLNFASVDVLPFTPEKQQQLAAALLASLNVHPSYTIASIKLSIIQNSTNRARRLQTTLPGHTTLVQATLAPTPTVTKETLTQAVPNINTLFRSQADKLPWWTGV